MEKIIFNLKNGESKEFEIPNNSSVYGNYKKRGKSYTLQIARDLDKQDLSVDEDNKSFIERVSMFVDSNDDKIDTITWVYNDIHKTIPINDDTFMAYGLSSNRVDYTNGMEDMTFSTILGLTDEFKVV